MKKRFLLTILIFICSSACVVALPACIINQPNGGTHTHSYNSVYYPPTCYDYGYYQYDCSCGDSYTEYDYDSTPDHDYELIAGREVSCIQSGWDEYSKCKHCGFAPDCSEIPASSIFHDLEVDYLYPTCTEGGYVRQTCRLCDYSAYFEFEPSGHTLIHNSARGATCYQVGWEAYDECTRCDYSTYKEIPKTNDHSLIQREGVPATCTEKGYKDYLECRLCDYTTYEEIAPLGHDTAEHDGQAPTCSAVGWADYETCTRCDYTTYNELPMLEHEVFGWTAYRSYCAYACVECGFVQDTDLHNFVEGKCSSCGLERNTYLDTFNGVYGYEYFGTMSNGESLQALYADIDYEVRAFHESGESVSGDCCFAEINYSDYGLSIDEAVSVWKTFRDDNPLYYWLSNALTYTVEEIRLCVFDNYADGAVRTAQNEKIYSSAEVWTKHIGVNSSAYLKTLAFHDMILDAVDYAYDDNNNPQTADWAHSILGIFEERGAVCESYAKTFQLLLNVCGVENLLVTGTGGREDHAWNLVKLDDGEWYWYDLTWDDAPNYFWGISYYYFSATDKSFLKSHTAHTSNGTGINFLYDLPARSEKEYLPEDDILKQKFTVNSLEFVIIGYNLVSLSDILGDGDIEIPSSVTYGGREFKVAAIGDYNYYGEFASIGNHHNVTSVSIPSSVVFIAYNSFHAWNGLKGINVSGNNSAFSSEDGILFTKDRNILIMFPNAHRFTSYSIPEETTAIGYHAFGTSVRPGRNLESLTVPASVTLVGVMNWGSGYNNISLGEWNNIVISLTGKQELIIDENNPAYKVVNGLIINGKRVETCMPHTEEVIIPDFVTSITARAFREIDWVKSVVLPEGWKEIPDDLFTYCHGLESIYIPDSVTSIGDSAFWGCKNLKSVIIPEGVTEIKDDAFYACGLIEVVIPDSVQSIGKSAFNYCHSLVSVTLGSGLKEIGEKAFEHSNKILEVRNFSELEITKGSTDNGYIGYYADKIFNSAEGESKLTVTDDGYIFYETEGKYFLVGYSGNETQLVLPESYNGHAYDIYGYAFFESNITSIVIPDCVKTVGTYAFYQSSLTQIDFGNGITTIESAAFMWCKQLDSIILPASVVTIESAAFTGCGELTVYYAGSEQEWRDLKGAFYNVHVTVIYTNN